MASLDDVLRLNEADSALQVAIVGMAGRFPGSGSLDEFWENLRTGVESISILTDEELQHLGVPRATRRNHQFVRAAALVKDIDRFDATFFGYSPREAEIMDPQHRIFLEVTWEALEHAGYVPENYPGLIGVYAGTSLSSYLLYNVLSHQQDIHAESNFELMIGNDKDFLSTRVAYKLNLKGPAIDVQTGCSTSLVAVHLACQSLLCYHCDMALAGGVSIQVPQRSGYYYVENGISSPDGHCRAFDANAQGTVFGNGAGVVVLKRLQDALRDRDHIHAIIRGSAINNDGAQKVGYTAPSVEGQSSVIQAAQELAGINPASISYVECHGTGTRLGDPVEVLALKSAFAETDKKQFCALGTVKSNIGHLDAAAGIAGLIKTTLAIEHAILPPSLHYETPNERLELENSPFYVNRSCTQWKGPSSPLRAGVSSFGIGGTNAHVILEEAPSSSGADSIMPFRILLLSAKSEGSLDTSVRRLLDHLRANPNENLGDIAYTLAVGRKQFEHRCALVAGDRHDAINILDQLDPSRMFRYQNTETNRPVVFMFPGGGSQHVQMGLDLYKEQPAFQSEVDACAAKLLGQLGFDIREFLYPDQSHLQSATERMKDPLIGLPTLFVVEYALAKLWMSWGVIPTGFIGHSLGEYTAATLAGVFSLDDALALVVTRAKLFSRLPGGAMVGVSLSSTAIEPYLGEELSLAAVNGESQCLVSGTHSAIESLIEHLSELEIDCRRLQIEVASHSHLVDPILPEFGAFLRTIKMRSPQIPYISNVTGTWITNSDATNPDYWLNHLRQPVLFGPGFQVLSADESLLFLEVGPSHTLSTLAKASGTKREGLSVVPSMRHPYDHQSDTAVLMTAVAKLWLAGGGVEWTKFYAGEQRSRVTLPAYSFERRRYWIEPRAGGAGTISPDKVDDIDQWFYLPSWKLLPRPLSARDETPAFDNITWVIFVDEGSLGDLVADHFRKYGSDKVFVVGQGSEFQSINSNQYVLDPESQEDYVRLLEHLASLGRSRLNIIHMWSVTSVTLDADRSFDTFQSLGMYSLVYLAQALAALQFTDSISLWAISSGLHYVESQDILTEEKATLLSPCIVIPQEYENVTCWAIDIASTPAKARQTSDWLAAEIEARTANKVVALRGDRRWIRSFEQITLAEATVDETSIRDGVYVITGGFGGVGLHIGDFLSRLGGVKLALLERTGLPPRDQWEGWLEEHPDGDATSRKIRKVRDLEAKGADVVVLSADVANEDQLMVAMKQVADTWGRIDGIFHTAGIAGESAMQLIPDVEKADCERHFYPKVTGTRALAKVVEAFHPRFCQLFSSNAALMGGLGSVAYSASSLFMDAFAEKATSQSETIWLSVDWDPWLVRDDDRIHELYDTSLQKHALTQEESWECLRRICASRATGRVVVSTGNLPLRLKEWTQESAGAELDSVAPDNLSALEIRPALASTYIPPRSDLERLVIGIWQATLRIDRLGVYDNFFDLGGNSLLGMRMISAIRKELHIDLPIMALFEGPTVDALCKRIESKDAARPDLQESEVRGQRRREGAFLQDNEDQGLISHEVSR